jgi:hypothetical protein
MRKQLKKLEDVFDSKIRETQMFLTSFDFSSIDSLDPATGKFHIRETEKLIFSSVNMTLLCFKQLLCHCH